VSIWPKKLKEENKKETDKLFHTNLETAAGGHYICCDQMAFNT